VSEEKESSTRPKWGALYFIYGSGLLVTAQNLAPDSLAWSGSITGLMLAWAGVGAYGMVRRHRRQPAELERQHARELRRQQIRQQIRELETDLGYEPLDLAMDDPEEIWTRGPQNDRIKREGQP
jgi:hypothetical protein